MWRRQHESRREHEPEHQPPFTGYCHSIRGATRLAIGLGVLAALSFGISGPPAGAVGGIRFANLPRKGQLRITTSAYQLVVSRKNGGILSLVDRAAKKQLVAGQGGCMWGARAEGGTEYIGGCSFSPKGPRRFSYRWDPRTARLTFRYTRSSITATPVVSASTNYFDVAVTVTNTLHKVLTSMLVPDDLAGKSAEVTAGDSP